MDINKSYVYKGIRKAAVQGLFSFTMIIYCVSIVFLVVLVYGLLFEFDLEENPDIIFPLIFFILGFFLYVVLGTANLIRNVVALFSPEESIAAKRYADIVSFEEMCERVETQYPQPFLPLILVRWNITALADFIIYKRYGDFAVIPYSAIQDVRPWRPAERDADEIGSRKAYVAIQDTLSHQYVIECASLEDENELIYILNGVLQDIQEGGNYL